MEFEPDISKLENVITRLIDEYNTVKKKYEQLNVDLADSLAQIDELKEEKITLLNEKNTVHSRVTNILEKLSDWEEDLESNADVDSDSDISPKDTGGQLFSTGSSS